MTIQKGDLFRIKTTGKILEITGEWGPKEYRYNIYNSDGTPSCGANGQHNLVSDIERWHQNGGLEKIKKLPVKRFLIKYYGKRLIIDNIEVIK